MKNYENSELLKHDISRHSTILNELFFVFIQLLSVMCLNSVGDETTHKWLDKINGKITKVCQWHFPKFMTINEKVEISQVHKIVHNSPLDAKSSTMWFNLDFLIQHRVTDNNLQLQRMRASYCLI